MRKLPIFIAFVATLTFPNITLAEQHCNFASFKDNTKFDQTISEKVNYLKIIDKTMFDSMKSDSSYKAFMSGSFGLFDGSADFSKFNVKRNTFFKKIKYNRNFDSATSFTSNSLNDNGLKAYLSCLEANQNGLFVKVVRATESSVEISLLWKPSLAAPSNIDINVKQLTGADSEKGKFPKSLKRGQRIYVRIDRESDKEFYLNIGSPDTNDHRILIDKEYVAPESIRVFHTQAWADANSYSTAPTNSHRYVNRSWVVDLASFHRELQFSFSQGGKGEMFTDVRRNGEFRVWMAYLGKDYLDPSWRIIGESRRQLTNCAQSCNFWITTRRIR